MFEQLPKGWKVVTVDEIKKPKKYSCVGGPFGSSLSRKHYVEDGVPVIRGVNLGGDSEEFVDEDFVFVTPEKADELNKNLAFPGDVVFTQRGTLGQVGIIPEKAKFRRYVVSQSQMKLTVDEKIADPYYVLSYFRSPSAKRMIENSAIVGGVPHINLGLLKAFPLPLPPLNEQKTIVDVLRSIDKKIALNRDTNSTLEQIAQALFKSWFVDFNPVRAKVAVREHLEQRAAEHGEPLPAPAALEEAQNIAAAATIAGLNFDPADIDGTHALLEAKLAEMVVEQRGQLMETAELFPVEFTATELGSVPAGWGVTTLDRILEFNPRRSLKKGVSAPYLDMRNVPTQGHIAEDVYLRNFGSGTKFINGDTLLARITPCLENGKTAYVDFLAEGKVGWGSTEFIVLRPKGERPPSLGYLMARLESFRALAIQSMTGTSGRQRANAKALAMTRWLDYPLDLLERFDGIAGAYLRAAKNNGDESKTLSQLRDTLLPKLLSGEIQLTPEPLAEAS